MRCNEIPRRMIVFVLTVLLLVVMSGAIGVVSAGPGNQGEPSPVTPPPDGSSTSTGDDLLLLGLLLGVGGVVLL